MIMITPYSGKSSLKKTLSGEDYEPGEKPSSGINADPSVTRVTFKQFKEWVQQPSSKADTHRLNLEYIDAVIDYILNFIRQPQVCKCYKKWMGEYERWDGGNCGKDQSSLLYQDLVL